MAASRPSDPDLMLKYLQAFRSLGPPTYAGNSDFVEAEDWLRGVTKCMDTIDAPIELRVTLAAFMLTGEADRWQLGNRHRIAKLMEAEEKVQGIRVHLAATDGPYTLAINVVKPAILSAIVPVIGLLLRTAVEDIEGYSKEVLQGEIKVRKKQLILQT
ncbi:hypothetical protein TIFTF001_028832 [Ficus carica]|uniref:Uncharacterized protein n=1 Tax=Ficus carica TaxID=3494 RepID=A0AA88J2I6_FICCA|nr:hypothetical protein TIFTF001_028832 [Ficus carica]